MTIGTPTTGIATAAGGSTYTLSHNCAAGTKVLVVGAAVIYQSGGGGTSMQWNGVAMTPAVVQNSAAVCTGIWYLRNPASGVHNVTLTDTENAGVAANSPWVYAVDLSGSVQGIHIGTTQSGTYSPTYTVQGTDGAVFDVFYGDTKANVDATWTTIWTNQLIGLADKTGASYKTHTGSNISATQDADLVTPFLAGAEFMGGSDFIPSIGIC